MDVETLFLRTVADLEARAEMRDPYEVLRASLLIRQLFLDGGASLFDRVNRGLRLPRPSFRVHPATKPPWADFYIVADGIDPEHSPNAPGIVEVDRDAFFGLAVAFVKGNTITVRDVVTYAAHVLGGVHVGRADDSKKAALVEVSSRLQLVGTDPALQIVRPIGRICVRTLRPYRDALAARQGG